MKNVLEKIDIAECNPVSTPTQLGLDLHQADDEECTQSYWELEGCIMYAMLGSRPNLYSSV